ncbi:MAG: hypothetical protein ABIE68_03550 [bacterium]
MKNLQILRGIINNIMITTTQELKAQLDNYEKVISGYLDEFYSQYSNMTPEIKKSIIKDYYNPDHFYDPRKFLEDYYKSNYPKERAVKLVQYVMDIKLQKIFMDIDCYLYSNGINKSDPSSTPLAYIRRLSFQQTLIGKIGVIWDRIMLFIYLLENGKEIQGKKIQKSFFNFIERDEKWKFMEVFKEVLEKFKNEFRTPEFHESSTLRRYLTENEIPNDNLILKPLNKAMNNIWENTLAIVQGRSAYSFNELHGDNMELLKKYISR